MFDLAAALATGQPFLGHIVKRQCGVLLIAAEGADEVRLRLDAVVRDKCGGAERISVPLVRNDAAAAAEGCGQDADRDGAAGRQVAAGRVRAAARADHRRHDHGLRRVHAGGR